MLTYSFALDLATGDVRPLLPGVLWVTFLFAGIIASGRSFAAEVEQGTFDALMVAPVSRTALYAAKVASNLLALLLIELAVLVLATILFNTVLLTPELIAIMALGTLGYVSLTTLLSTLGSRVRSREVLMPVLALPLLVPLLIAAVPRDRRRARPADGRLAVAAAARGVHRLERAGQRAAVPAGG